MSKDKLLIDVTQQQLEATKWVDALKSQEKLVERPMGPTGFSVDDDSS